MTDQMDLTDIDRTLCSTTIEYTFMSCAHGTFSRIDNMLGHKIDLSNFKKTEIRPNILSHPNGIKLEINSKRKIEKIQEHMQHCLEQ